MKINLRQVVLGYDDKPLTKGDKDNLEEVTYFDVFTTALAASFPNETLTAEKKNEIYQLTMKLYKEKEPNLTVNQLTLIKERVDKAYHALVYGRVCDLIDGVESGGVESENSAESDTKSS